MPRKMKVLKRPYSFVFLPVYPAQCVSFAPVHTHS